MKTEFTKVEIMYGRGCYSREEVKKLSFINLPCIPIQTILESEIPIKDKRWFIWNNCDLTLDQKKDLALQLAWCVLPIYERKYPDNPAVKECLQAIEDFKIGKISIDILKEKRKAAYAYVDAAYAAVDAAYAAAYAAVDAAYAYVDAAYAAAYAAYAAVDAAYAAVDAAGPSYSQKLQEILIAFMS